MMLFQGIPGTTEAQRGKKDLSLKSPEQTQPAHLTLDFWLLNMKEYGYRFQSPCVGICHGGYRQHIEHITFRNKAIIIIIIMRSIS